jgi:putative ABC transport system permease protein
MSGWLQDVRIGARTLIKRPGFSSIVVVTLALGIGANAAIFSVVNAVLLRPLPYPEPDGLVRIWSAYPDDDEWRGTSSQLDVDDWRAESQLFDAVAAYPSVRIGGYVMTGIDTPEELATTFVSPDFFEVFRVTADLGRTFSETDHVEGDNRVVVLSHGSWQRRFGSDPAIVGKSLVLQNVPYTIIGVMPEEFVFPARATEIWAPLSLIPESGVPRHRFVRWLNVVGRIRAGVSLQEAEAELSTIAARLSEAYPESNERLTAVSLRRLDSVIIADIRPALLTVFGAVGIVLLIVCANVANLVLVRCEGRSREIAVRSALGAGGARIARGLVVESLLLGVLGGLLSIGLAIVSLEALIALAPSDVPRLENVSVDGAVVAFTLLLSVLTGVLVGLMPAFRVVGADPNAFLKKGSRGIGTGQGRYRLGRVLVVAEVALVVLLAVGASLLIRSYGRLLAVETGIVTNNLLTMDITAQTFKYPERPDYIGFFTRVLEHIEQVPGVRSVGLVRPFPLRHDTFDGESFSFDIVGRPAADQSDRPEAAMRFVSPGYFQTMGIPLLSGRDFGSRDGPDVPIVAIVDRVAAERYWPGEDPVGQRITAESGAEATIIGVVGGVRQMSLSEEPGPALYVTYTQVGRVGMTFVVSTRVEPASLIESIKRAVWEVDPDQPIQQIATMEAVVHDAAAEPRFSMSLLGSFAGLALVLAAVGIYGVISYTVGQRTHDFGVRLAFGASRKDLFRMVLREGLALAAVGAAVGLTLSIATGRIVASLLFETSTLDVPSYLVATALLGLVALAACLVPAARAAKMDPLDALHYE